MFLITLTKLCKPNFNNSRKKYSINRNNQKLCYANIKQIKKPNLRKIRFWKKCFVYRKVCVTIRIIVLFHVILLNLSATGFPFFIAEY